MCKTFLDMFEGRNESSAGAVRSDASANPALDDFYRQSVVGQVENALFEAPDPSSTQNPWVIVAGTVVTAQINGKTFTHTIPLRERGFDWQK